MSNYMREISPAPSRVGIPLRHVLTHSKRMDDSWISRAAGCERSESGERKQTAPLEKKCDTAFQTETSFHGEFVFQSTHLIHRSEDENDRLKHIVAAN